MSKRGAFYLSLFPGCYATRSLSCNCQMSVVHHLAYSLYQLSREYVCIAPNLMSVCLNILHSRILGNDVNLAVPYKLALRKYHSAFISVLAALFAESINETSLYRLPYLCEI